MTEFYDPVPFVDRYKKIYKAFAGHRYGGCFQQFKPQLFVRDPDLIKHILNTDFEYFRDRGNIRYHESEPLTKQLFNAPGDLWKSKYTVDERINVVQ